MSAKVLSHKITEIEKANVLPSLYTLLKLADVFCSKLTIGFENEHAK